MRGDKKNLEPKKLYIYMKKFTLNQMTQHSYAQTNFHNDKRALKRVCDVPQFWLSDPSHSCKFKTVDSIRLDERKTIRCRLHIRQMNGNNNSRSLKKNKDK